MAAMAISEAMEARAAMVAMAISEAMELGLEWFQELQARSLPVILILLRLGGNFRLAVDIEGAKLSVFHEI